MENSVESVNANIKVKTEANDNSDARGPRNIT